MFLSRMLYHLEFLDCGFAHLLHLLSLSPSLKTGAGLWSFRLPYHGSILLLVCNTFYLLFFFLIYLFMTVLGLRCCMQSFSSYGKRGLLFVEVHGLLIAVASLVAEHRL